MLFPKTPLHFIGIGGVGMRGLAEWALQEGYPVTGSDRNPSAATRRLEALGATIARDHESSLAEAATVVVRSSAIGPENSEVQRAIRANKHILLRGAFLAELARSRQTVAVCGSHGKSTTAALIAHCLRDLWPCHAYVGARVNSLGSSFHFGDPGRLVAEVDESDGTFLHFPCDLPVLTGLSLDHVTHYGSAEALREAFRQFLGHSSPLQRAIVYGEDALALDVAAKAGKRIFSYGLSETCDVRAADIASTSKGTAFRMILGHGASALSHHVQLPLLGKHNVINALGAVACGVELGLQPLDLAKRLETFQGVERRLEKLVSVSGIDLYSDYAHNPQKIAAALDAVSEAYGQKRVMLIAEPHRFSRLQSLWPDFVTALRAASELVLLPVYSAGEKPLDGVSSESLARELEPAIGSSQSSGLSLRCMEPNAENFSAILERAQAVSNGAPYAIVVVGAGLSHEHALHLARLLENFGGETGSQANQKESPPVP